MARGVPSNGLWRGQESLSSWVARMQATAPMCACGCGERIVVQAHHRRYGVPDFVQGHHTRVDHPRYLGVDRWVAENQGKHPCACGCGKFIDVVPVHHTTSIPKFRHHHGPTPVLGHGPDHPRFIKDRAQVRSRRGRGFTPWVRREILRRADSRCQKCSSLVPDGELECDHLVAISFGGTADADNGQAICRACHRVKTRRDREWATALDRWARRQGHRSFIEAVLSEEAA